MDLQVGPFFQNVQSQYPARYYVTNKYTLRPRKTPRGATRRGKGVGPGFSRFELGGSKWSQRFSGFLKGDKKFWGLFLEVGLTDRLKWVVKDLRTSLRRSLLDLELSMPSQEGSGSMGLGFGGLWV